MYFLCLIIYGIFNLNPCITDVSFPFLLQAKTEFSIKLKPFVCTGSSSKSIPFIENNKANQNQTVKTENNVCDDNWTGPEWCKKMTAMDAIIEINTANKSGMFFLLELFYKLYSSISYFN